MIASAHWHTVVWFWPLDVDWTMVHGEKFACKAKTVDDRMAYSHCRTRLREDVGIIESNNRELKSGVMEDMHLSQQEILLQKHYGLVDELAAQI